jgi:hypothetical protein
MILGKIQGIIIQGIIKVFMKDIMMWTITSIQDMDQHAQLFGKKSYEDDEKRALGRSTRAKDICFRMNMSHIRDVVSLY